MYDPNYFVYLFVSLFPNGCGGKPDGTSLEHWAHVLQNRYPRKHARHSLFQLAVFDVLSRMKVNEGTFSYQRMSTKDIEVIGRMSERAVKIVQLTFKANLHGRAMSEALNMAGYGMFTFSRYGRINRVSLPAMCSNISVINKPTRFSFI